MAFITVEFNGNTYQIPGPRQQDWGTQLNTFLQALASGAAAVNAENTFTQQQTFAAGIAVTGPYSPESLQLPPVAEPAQHATDGQVFVASDGNVYALAALTAGVSSPVALTPGGGGGFDPAADIAFTGFNTFAQGPVVEYLNIPAQASFYSPAPDWGRLQVKTSDGCLYYSPPQNFGTATAPVNLSLAASTVYAPKTANYTLLDSETLGRFANTGASGTVVLTLPVLVDGLEFSFACTTNQILQVVHNPTDQPGVRIPGESYAVGAQVDGTSGTAVYSTFTAVAIAGYWVVKNVTGTVTPIAP